MNRSVVLSALVIPLLLISPLHALGQSVAVNPPGFTNLEVERFHKSMKKIDKAQLLVLTNAVAADAGVSGPLADAAAPLLKSVAEAEYQFQLGNNKAVREDAVIHAVNLVAKTLNAPAYAYTGKYEVRSVRARMALSEPTFIGHKAMSMPTMALKSGAQSNMLNDKMSPLEALHVTATLLRQKLENPDFQMTDPERIASRQTDPVHSPHMSKEQRRKRVDEMHVLVYSAPSNVSLLDIFSLTISSLQSFGVSAAGGAQ